MWLWLLGRFLLPEIKSKLGFLFVYDFSVYNVAFSFVV